MSDYKVAVNLFDEDAIFDEQCKRQYEIHKRNTDFAHAFGFEDSVDWVDARVSIAQGIMQSLASNPNCKSSIREMAEWAHLGADILLSRLAAGVHIQATGVPPDANGQQEQKAV